MVFVRRNIVLSWDTRKIEIVLVTLYSLTDRIYQSSFPVSAELILSLKKVARGRIYQSRQETLKMLKQKA